MKRNLLLPIILLSGLKLMSQSSPVSSGGEGSGPGGTVSFSIGQLVVESTIDSQGSISPGVQQTYESSSVYVNDELFNNNLQVYPNPATHLIQLEFASPFEGQLIILDIQGNTVATQEINSKSVQIDASNWSAGTYMLQVQKDKQSVSVHRVVKG
jgi:hypothetical protein